jgi:hypothetical protein
METVVLLMTNDGPMTGAVENKGQLVPFLTDGDGLVLAGGFARPGDLAETWCLPGGVDTPAWVAVAIEHWHASAPDRFPRRADWLTRPEWITPSERAAIQAAEDHDATLRHYLEQHQRRAVELATNLTDAQGAATEGARRLLTRQGDHLVAAVAQTLIDIGFGVQHMDPLTAEKGAKLEDLRVSVDGWEALAEVRGYRGGAQLNDMLRVGRFVARFAAENGRLPRATWYVVNQFIDRDPDTRDRPLASNPEEVATFAESSGLIIDTRDLFRLWSAAIGGELTHEEARLLLVNARGMFAYPVGTVDSNSN